MTLDPARANNHAKRSGGGKRRVPSPPARSGGCNGRRRRQRCRPLRRREITRQRVRRGADTQREATGQGLGQRRAATSGSREAKESRGDAGFRAKAGFGRGYATRRKPAAPVPRQERGGAAAEEARSSAEAPNLAGPKTSKRSVDFEKKSGDLDELDRKATKSIWTKWCVRVYATV